jgi:predicted benzoate:H+ symporter BenE
MREVQGGIIGSGLIVMLIGVTGIIKPVLRAISPITVAANIGVLVSACIAQDTQNGTPEDTLNYK